ncbi:SMP-30/gluconolactonase/LRE family protein [Melaminivora jejuensis]|uniref:SMP-30/gluconolactonase/LRE family protein n=1 Tax=Melaminivora jejuensis TaxID=1267217 RepID=UPI001E2ACC5C|nr:SMP-30/gluconolactonase/LRE family protein [Melaminivora jejuensis]UHJ65087.1 SMP-30/gluconolactonase/LRE family protein [Melaminivora jejuensis]
MSAPAPASCPSSWSALPGQSPALLGESPLWHPLEQRLYWVDIAGRALLRARLDGSAPERWPLPTEPGCIAPARRGGCSAGLVVSLRGHICHASEWGGPLAEIARLPFDAATQRANDGKCDALGRLWVGSIHEPASGARQPVGALYCIDARAGGPARVQRIFDGVATANGLAWAPDGRTLYFADTPTHAIRAWDCDAQLQPVDAPRVLHRFATREQCEAAGQPYGGRPDGASVDAAGNYWCAAYEGARVLCLSPVGEVLADLPVPVQCPTMPVLGGPDGHTLFVTSASGGRPEAELARLPLSGQVLHRPVAATALPVAWCELG